MTNPAALSAFLFTDIEGSSLKWLNHRAAMQGALATHDRILRDAITGHGGEVFKTAGDAFFAAFRHPSDAVNAAIAAQTKLNRDDWSSVDGLKVRMAVHCGTAEKRDGDYFGPALNRCARLLVLGHGGQILVTGATAELLASEREVKESTRLVGTHALDDPMQPVAIHQVVLTNLPQDFPPLRAPETRPTNLPRHLTPLIGREAELATIRERIAANRLVTLTGPGGIGKTRLAIEAGIQLLPDFANGVWLVELAPLSDPQLVVSAIGAALRLDLSGNRPPREILIRHLEQQDILVILDNCEHLIDAVAELSEAIMAGTHRAHILASSQELIGLPGEQVLRVASLTMPESATPSADDALRASAVQMFVDRVKAADPKFVFDDRAAPVVAGICRRLDGIALAIEMAAARVPMLGLETLAQGLDARFQILTGGKRTAMPRQRTLHAALDWSHSLLNENDRVVFRRLGQFAGGFTLKAASAIVGDEGLREIEVIDCLSDLVAKSLVVADTTEAGTRYRLLETTRAYALEKLGEAHESIEIARRHARYFRNLMSTCSEEWLTAPGEIWSTTYTPDIDNVRAAINWSFASEGESETAIALAAISHALMGYLNLFDESRRALMMARDRLTPETPKSVAAFCWAELGASLSHGGYNPSDEAVSALQRGVAMLQEAGMAVSAGRTLFLLGVCHANRGDVSSVDAILAALQPLLESSNWSAIRVFSILSGMAAALRGDLSAARQFMTDAAGPANNSADRALSDFADMVLGMYIERAGEHEAAITHLRRVRERILNSRSVNMWRLLGTNLTLAVALSQAGHMEDALVALREGTTISHRIGTLLANVETAILVLAMSGRLRQAATLAGWTDAQVLRQKNSTRLGQLQRPRAEALLSEGLSAEELRALRQEGACLSEEEACRLVTGP